MNRINLKSLQKKAEKEIKESQNLNELDGIFKKYLGRKGELSQVLRSLSKMSKVKRTKIGKEANKLKTLLKSKFDQKANRLKEKTRKSTERAEWIDITIPGEKLIVGHLHPLTQTRRKIEDIFRSMGFSVVDGPEVETEWYNFDALNIPQDHPARDLWDTLYVKGGLLLRTHTSPVQVRYIEKTNPPLKIIVPGRIFRHEATDASHEINFYQVEGLMIDEDISVANFKSIITKFFKRFFGKNVKIRLRPSYFPFTEPSFEIDCSCPMCGQKGCSACGDSGWMELMGAGMVHPNVLKNSGLNPHNWQGFAFGMGLDRLTMIRHKIGDVRLFYSGDLRFLNQF